MGSSNDINWLGVIITWIGVVVAFVSAVRAHNFQQRAQAASEESNRIQARLLEIEHGRDERERREQTRARFTVSLMTHGDHTDVVVTNQGPAEARNVRVVFKGGSRNVESAVRNPPVFPIATMKPSASFPLRLSAPRALVGAMVNPVIVEWEHADGTSDRLETNPS